MGFKYPVVDVSKCVECGMCERVCSFNDDYKTPTNFPLPTPYGVRMKHIDEVMKSRSGGAFAAFSDYILDRGGVIYGAGYGQHFVVTHKRAETQAKRDEFRGSKYVQSDLTGIFRQVKDDLMQGKHVLFSGTPCQTSGLQSYLPENLKDKLLVVDIVCHSVPSPKIWEEYLNYIEKKYNKTVVSVNFRDKGKYGWKAHKETITLAEPKIDVSPTVFTFLFHENLIQRPSCGECHYCNLRRTGDLTLADFWGWEKTGSNINEDDKGLSLVLVNTSKGKSIFESVRHQFNLIEPKLEDCIQNHLKTPTQLNPKADEFNRDYVRYGFDFVVKKYGNTGIRYRLKATLNRILNLPSAIKRRLS